MQPLDAVEPELQYEEIVRQFHAEVFGEKLVHIKRGRKSQNLLVGLATLKNNGVFAGLTSYYRYFDGDVICLVDPDNTYYLRDDGGKHIRRVLEHLLRDYSSKHTVFCGASMAGYASVDLALHFNTNAVVNNPQINLDSSLRFAWKELREVIERIPLRRNIDDLAYSHRESVIGAMIGQHPMDLANRDALQKLCASIPGVGLVLGSSHDRDHKYYYQGYRGFLEMLNIVASLRNMVAAVHAKFPCEARGDP